MTLDNVSFITKIAMHGGVDAFTQLRCVALFDTGSPITFVRHDELDRMPLVGATSAACERPCSPRSWGSLGESALLRNLINVLLSVQFFPDNEPTCSLAVLPCVLPPSVMQHHFLLGRDSGMCCNTRSYRAPPPVPQDNRVFGELTLSHHTTTGVWACAVDPTATGGGFHLLYDGTVGFTLSDEPQLLDVNLVRSNSSPVPIGHYRLDMLPQPGIRLMQKTVRCLRATGASHNRCRRPRSRRPRRGRPRLHRQVWRRRRTGAVGRFH